MVGGRPVPAGWYSEPWWRPVLLGGGGAVGGMVVASALVSGFGAAAVGGDLAADPGVGDGGFDGGFDGGGLVDGW